MWEWNKIRKIKYKKQLNDIKNKYKLMNEYNEIIYNKKVEKINMIYLKKIKKYNYDNKIENLSNIKD